MLAGLLDIAIYLGLPFFIGWKWRSWGWEWSLFLLVPAAGFSAIWLRATGPYAVLAAHLLLSAIMTAVALGAGLGVRWLLDRRSRKESEG